MNEGVRWYDTVTQTNAGELQLRNLSESTIETYLWLVERYVRYFKKSPQQLGAEDVRGYLQHLIEEKKTSSTVIQARSALRFLYVAR